MTSLATQLIRDPAALHALAPDWWDLWRAAPRATPFQSPAWLLPWWDVFGPGQLASIAVRDGDRLVALAPLYLEIGALGLRLLPLGFGITDYCDVLIDAEYESEAANGILEAAAHVAPWEIWEMTELPPEAGVLKLPAPDDLHSIIAEASESPILFLPRSLDGLSTVTPQLRQRQVRRAQKAAAKRGETAIVVGDADNAEALLNDLIRLHTRQCNSRGESGVFADRRVIEFHTAAISGLMASNLGRLYELMIGDKVAAIFYGFLDRGSAYAYLTGYDPEFANESPGLIVVDYAIREAIKEGAREFHFLRGDETHKYQWGASAHRNKRRTFWREPAVATS